MKSVPLSVRQKLMLQSGAAALAICLLTAYAVLQTQRVTSAMAESQATWVKAAEVADDATVAQTAFKTQVQEWKNILIRGNDSAAYEKHLKAFEAQEKTVQAALQRLAKTLPEIGQEASAAEAALKEHTVLGERYRDNLKSFAAGDPESGKKVDQQVAGMDRELANALKRLSDVVTLGVSSKTGQDSQHAADVLASVRVWLLAGGALVLIVLIGVGLWLSKSISQGVNELHNVMIRVADNADLSLRASVRSSDEIGACARALNSLLEAFGNTVRVLREEASQVAGQANQVATQLGALETASQQQNSATVSVSAAVEELTVSIAQVQDGAVQAREQAAHSANAAGRGQQAVSETNAQMGRISGRVAQTATVLEELGRHSDAISGIVQTVKEIADQTNLLALNAAIEAARAGEQGRGFAVVADEVRKLAEKTTRSTDEISELVTHIQSSSQQAVSDIHDVVQDVDSQSQLTDRTDTAIGEVLSAVEHSREAAARISEALGEQSSASELIAKEIERIAQMSDNTQQAFNELGSSAQTLDAASRRLNESASRYRV